MDFYAILDQVIDLLKQRGRVSYRALKVQFHLDDEALEALKDELLEVHHLARDQDGRMLVWTGEANTTPEPIIVQSAQQEVRREDPRTPVAAPPAESRACLDREWRRGCRSTCSASPGNLIAFDPGHILCPSNISEHNLSYTRSRT